MEMYISEWKWFNSVRKPIVRWPLWYGSREGPPYIPVLPRFNSARTTVLPFFYASFMHFYILQSFFITFLPEFHAILPSCNSSLLPFCHTSTKYTRTYYLRMCNRDTVAKMPSADRDDLIKFYFSEGYPYPLIVCFLYFVNGINISLQQLKRELRKMNLRRRVQPSRNHMNRIESLVMVRIPFYMLL